MARIGVVVDVEVGSEGIEDLAGVCEVCLEGVHCGVRERGQVEVENGVTFGEEVRDHVATCFSRATGEHDTFACGRGHDF